MTRYLIRNVHFPFLCAYDASVADYHQSQHLIIDAKTEPISAK